MYRFADFSFGFAAELAGDSDVILTMQGVENLTIGVWGGLTAAGYIVLAWWWSKIESCRIRRVSKRRMRSSVLMVFATLTVSASMCTLTILYQARLDPEYLARVVPSRFLLVLLCVAHVSWIIWLAYDASRESRENEKAAIERHLREQDRQIRDNIGDHP